MCVFRLRRAVQLFSGKGPIGQLALETSLPPNVIEGGLVAMLGYIVFQSLRPGSPTWSRENQQDIQKRPAGTAIDAAQSLLGEVADHARI